MFDFLTITHKNCGKNLPSPGLNVGFLSFRPGRCTRQQAISNNFHTLPISIFFKEKKGCATIFCDCREVSLHENVYDFSVDWDSIDKSDMLNIHKYLMSKNNIK